MTTKASRFKKIMIQIEKKTWLEKILIYTKQSIKAYPRRDRRVIFTLFSVFHTAKKSLHILIHVPPKCRQTTKQTKKPKQTYHFSPTRKKKLTKKRQDISNLAKPKFRECAQQHRYKYKQVIVYFFSRSKQIYIQTKY